MVRQNCTVSGEKIWTSVIGHLPASSRFVSYTLAKDSGQGCQAVASIYENPPGDLTVLREMLLLHT